MMHQTPNKAYNMSIRVKRALRELGDDIRKARLRRRLPMAVVAERASISRATLTKIERGDGGVALGNYAMVLHALGLLEHLHELAASTNDQVGLALEEEKLPRRVRL